MSRKYKFNNPDGMYFVSFAVVYWIDVFVRRTYKDVLIESLKFCQKNKGLRVHAWCIMSSHVHLIISSEGDLLQDIIRDYKSYTATQLRKAIEENQQESRKEWMLWMMQRAAKKNSNNNDFQFWQQHNKPIELFTKKVIQQKLDYIHNNPVVEGIVEQPEEYVYSSAKDYAEMKGLIDLYKID
jgi:putative transposase